MNSFEDGEEQVPVPEPVAAAAPRPTLRVVLTDGAIRNGYIHFPLEKSIFPSACYGDPSGNKKGRAIHIVDDAGNSYSDDIRVQGNTARIRARFGSYFRGARAAGNDVAELTETEPGTYSLRISRAGQEAVPPPAPAKVTPRPPEPTRITGGQDAMLATNTIFYGPPGTGKTYSTTSFAVEKCDGVLPDGGEPAAVRFRFEELRTAGRVSFVTFHQSYGYEEFVQGLRPKVGAEGKVVYSVRPGAFLEACESASRQKLVTPGLTGKPLKDRTIFKMSLGAAATQEGAAVFDFCLKHQCVLLGWGRDIDFTDCDDKGAIEKKIQEDAPLNKNIGSDVRFVDCFKHEIKVGDLILVSQGNKFFRAIAEVTGAYEFVEDAPFHQMRAVRWLAIFEGSVPAEKIYTIGLSQPTLYRLKSSGIVHQKLDTLLSEQSSVEPAQPHVLIIDEINRANISKVFGELITLIEPDKREGSPNTITVKLPYDGMEFCVPSNLHIVGTMNTADRSIALLDTALRRRFDFVEVMPDPDLLKDVGPEGVDLKKLLAALNERVEALYDRDHTIGHAYFMQVKTMDDLEQVLRRKVLPLLQEYFFENWSKVRRVLNDLEEGDFVRKTKRPAIATDGEDEFPEENSVVYTVNKSKFPVHAYLRIYAGK